MGTGKKDGDKPTTRRVRLTSGMRTGEIVEVEPGVAESLLLSGKAEEPDTPDEDSRVRPMDQSSVEIESTPTSPDLDVVEMPSRATSPELDEVAARSVALQPEVKTDAQAGLDDKDHRHQRLIGEDDDEDKARGDGHGDEVSAVAQDREGDGAESHGKRVSAAARDEARKAQPDEEPMRADKVRAADAKPETPESGEGNERKRKAVEEPETR